MRAGLERLVAAAKEGFRARWGGAPAVVGFAPGRVNLLGEHTDYVGGLAMPAAIDRWVVAALRGRADGRCRLASADFAEVLDGPAEGATGWLRFATGALAEFGAVAAAPGGIEAFVVGDVPLGAGLSSSAAIEGALLNGLNRLVGAGLSDLEIARLGQRVEHHHLGLHSGLLDQMASQLSREGQVLILDFEAMRWRHVPADFGPWTWVLMDSGVRRELAGSAYETRVRECQDGLEAMRARGVPATSWRELPLEAVEAAAAAPDAPVWARRLRHGARENARVLAAAAALHAGDVPALGPLLQQSHASLRDDYDVSCPELDLLAAVGDAQPGCLGGRLMGGGFGGCTIHLVRRDAVSDFTAAVSAAFEARFGRPSRGYGFELVGGGGALGA